MTHSSAALCAVYDTRLFPHPTHPSSNKTTTWVRERRGASSSGAAVRRLCCGWAPPLSAFVCCWARANAARPVRSTTSRRGMSTRCRFQKIRLHWGVDFLRYCVLAFRRTYPNNQWRRSSYRVNDTAATSSSSSAAAPDAEPVQSERTERLGFSTGYGTGTQVK